MDFQELQSALLKRSLGQERQQQFTKEALDTRRPGIERLILSLSARRENRRNEELRKEASQQENQFREALLQQFPQDQQATAGALPVETLQKQLANQLASSQELQNEQRIKKELLQQFPAEQQATASNLPVEALQKQLAKKLEVQEPLGQLSKEQFARAGNLRKEYTKNSNTFVKVRDAHNRIQVSATDPSAAGDLALIFNYMKVLDPGSTVREGEFATAENSRSIPDAIRQKYNKVMAGERLGAEQRDDFVNRSDKLFNEQLKSQNRLRTKFKTLAERSGLETQDVIIDFADKNKNKRFKFNVETGVVE